MASSIWAPGTNPVPLGYLLSLPTGASLVGFFPYLTLSAPTVQLAIQELKDELDLIPAPGTITTAKLADGAVTVVKLATDAVTDIKVAANAAISSSKLVFLQSGTGAVLQTVEEKQKQVKNVLDFLSPTERIVVAARSYAVDMSVNVQKAIDATAGMILEWPSGGIRIDKCLNVTQRGSTATVWRGAGFDTDMSSGTTVLCRTAADGTLSPGWMADFTGSQNITLSEINFYSAGANASTKGFLFARTVTYQYVQQVNLYKICVKVATNPGATSVGSIAIANNQAEQFKTDHSTFYADTPMVLMLNNNLTLVSPYSLIYSDIYSTTAMQFSATTFFAYTNPAVIMWGTASINFDNACVYARDSLSTTQYAIDLREGGVAYNYPHNLQIAGQVEGFPGGVAFSSAGMSAYNIKTELFLVALGAAKIVTAANVSLYNCEFNDGHPQNISGNVNLSCGTSNVLYGGKVVPYPGDTGIAGSPLLLGVEFPQDVNGNGLKSIVAGVSMTALGSPNSPQTVVDSEGFIQISGILQAGAVVAAGAVLGNVDAVHCPDRTINFFVFVSGLGMNYGTITPAGDITIGGGLVNLSQVDLNTIRFKQFNQ